MANDMAIKDLKVPIKFGWRLATVNEMKTNLKLVEEQVRDKDINKIYLSNGSWDLGPGTRAGSLHEMKVLLFLKEAPKFKILHRRENWDEIGEQGWRIACVGEVEPYKETVRKLIGKHGCTQVLLSDGWADREGSNYRVKIHNADGVLLIETPFPPDTGASSSVKEAKTSKRNPAKNGPKPAT